MHSEAAMPVGSELAASLLAFIRRRVPSAADADDLLQDVLLRTQHKLPQLREPERLNAWIFRVARNAIIDAGRGRRVWAQVFDNSQDVNESTLPIDDSQAHTSLSHCVRPLLASLSAHSQQALELTALGGLGQAEAAGQAGVSLTAMKSRTQRGRAELKAALLRCCTIEQDRRGGIVDFAAPPRAQSTCAGCQPSIPTQPSGSL